MEPSDTDLIYRGALALAIGLIVGFQRESKASALAGIRTFALFSMSGFFCALLEESGAHWAFATGLISLVAIVITGIFSNRERDKGTGLTSEMAAIVVYLLGAGFIFIRDFRLVVVAGGILALLLYLKESMHGFIGRMSKVDVKAVMQFVLLSLVILPLLPDESYDNFGVLNVRKIWLMVVLITGISLVSYTIQKIKRDSSGTLWSGILGGLISSTATTVTLSQFSAKSTGNLAIIPALVIASTVAFVRVLGEILIVSPTTFRSIVIPLSLLFGFMIVLSVFSYRHIKGEINEVPVADDKSPAQLKAAVIFGLLFALILYLSAWARSEYGDQGLYAVSLISGLIDVDAITLSTSELVERKQIETGLGWRLVMVAFLSNLFFKGIIVSSLARGIVRKQVLIHFGLSIFAGTLILVFG